MQSTEESKKGAPRSEGYNNSYSQWSNLIQEELTINSKDDIENYDKEINVKVTNEVGGWPPFEVIFLLKKVRIISH